MEKLWTIKEAAQVLGIGDGDVEQLVREGKLTGYKLGGKFLRFRPSQVEALKGTLNFRRHVGGGPSPVAARGATGRARDFLYFHDFYILSGSLLAVLLLYLVVSG